jgi:putative hemolysin
MTLLILEILIILLLLLGNGVFSMSEMAVVSARKSRLRVMAAGGDVGARTALELAESPNRFLPAVQLGITLVGLLAGAFGGITIAEQIAAALKPVPALAEYAEVIGVGIVVAALTFFSLVIGELVPKRLALANPELIASRMARPVEFLSRLSRPVVRLLGVSTDLVLWLVRAQPQPAPAISDDEVKVLLQEGWRAGVFHETEPRMVESVLALDQRPVREIMTPRDKLVFLNKDDSHDAVWHKIVVSGHSNYPVYEGRRDRVVGVVSVKAIYAQLAAGIPVRLSDLMLPPLTVPATLNVTGMLEAFRKHRSHIAVVMDSGGAVAGLVTLVDVLEAIVGEIPSWEERLKPEARRRQDGSWLVDGRFGLAKLEERLGFQVAAPEGESVSAFAAAQLGSAAREGASFVWREHQFEIMDMDQDRIDKVLVTPKPRAD